MARRKRKVTREISVETTESVLIWRGPEDVKYWCPLCGKATETVTAEQAAAAMGVSVHSIRTWIESSRLHTCEPERGITRICAASLALLPGDDPERP